MRFALGTFLLVFACAATAQEYPRPDLLVSTEWLAAHLEDPAIRVVDTRTKGYETGHLPGAVHLDIAWSRDAENPPSYLPDLESFADRLGKLGIGADTHVVFYDDRGGIYGTRPWVILQILGHRKASIVNGGWNKWVHEERPATAKPTEVTAREYVPALRKAANGKAVEEWIATSEQVLRASQTERAQILDSRTASEFDGSDAGNNPRAGAVPGAKHLFWEEALEGEFHMFRPASELEALFAQAGIRKGEPIITYCQGAGRAAHELFVLHLLGYEDLQLYMGSWEDWSRDPELPLK